VFFAIIASLLNLKLDTELLSGRLPEVTSQRTSRLYQFHVSFG